MPSEFTDLSYLLDYKDNSAFADACYKAMLGRTAGPKELQYAISMLEKGLSKRGFIYWVSRSPEFNNRFAIKDLNSGRLSCYGYKGIQKLLRLCHFNTSKEKRLREGSPAASDSPIGWTTSSVPTGFSRDTEYYALALSQICQIPKALQELTCSNTEGLFPVGYLAGELLTGLNKNTPIMPESFKLSNLDKPQNYWITSPELIFGLLTGHSLETFAQKTADTFLFTMPVLPASHKGVTVIWDCHWDEYETDRRGHICRWLKGSVNCGSIFIINRHTAYKKVRISFTFVAYPQSKTAIVMTYGDQKTTIPIKSTRQPVSFELWLNPGYNAISFTYLGTHRVPHAVSDFRIDDFGAESPTANETEVYRLSETDLGKNFYPYLLPDNYIRSRLHKSGFFEVAACSVSATYAIRQLSTTRYFYRGDELNEDCYYVYKDGENIDDTFSSVTIYLARRTGALDCEPFQET